MMDGVKYTGIPSKEEREQAPGVPSREGMTRGRVACIECVQEIPCNPCEGSCHFGAISIGSTITNLPVLDESRCTGCGACVAACPGLAITVLDRSYSDQEATVDFPFEYLPLPAVGDVVEAVNREGETVCEAKVLRVMTPPANEGTTVIRIAIPKKFIDEVRSIKRLKNFSDDDRGTMRVQTRAEKEQPLEKDATLDRVICRCQEVTEREIIEAIRDGARSVDGIKRRTRACMGLCQGKTCEKLIQSILARETGRKAETIEPNHVRMPVRPIAIGQFRKR
jgi:ferredoxin